MKWHIFRLTRDLTSEYWSFMNTERSKSLFLVWKSRNIFFFFSVFFFFFLSYILRLDKISRRVLLTKTRYARGRKEEFSLLCLLMKTKTKKKIVGNKNHKQNAFIETCVFLLYAEITSFEHSAYIHTQGESNGIFVSQEASVFSLEFRVKTPNQLYNKHGSSSIPARVWKVCQRGVKTTWSKPEVSKICAPLVTPRGTTANTRIKKYIIKIKCNSFLLVLFE